MKICKVFLTETSMNITVKTKKVPSDFILNTKVGYLSLYIIFLHYSNNDFLNTFLFEQNRIQLIERKLIPSLFIAIVLRTQIKRTFVLCHCRNWCLFNNRKVLVHISLIKQRTRLTFFFYKQRFRKKKLGEINVTRFGHVFTFSDDTIWNTFQFIQKYIKE